MTNEQILINQLSGILDASLPQLSTLKPSEWVEANIIMGKPFPGPYRYSKTPYCREIIDCISPEHPAKWIAVMKGAQIGISAGVLIPAMGWIIKENPGNTYFTVGAPDIVDKSVEKLDLMIDNANLRQYIKPQVNRKKAQKSGDTNTKKDFGDGFIYITTANNHKEWRDVSLKFGLNDDFESAKSSSKESGSTRKLIEQRFAAYADSHKIYYISTPELKESSNIEPAYLLGDQRRYLVPCQCCNALIALEWTIDVNGNAAGVYWKLDSAGKVIKSSVGYVCQECGNWFSDKNKYEMLQERGYGGEAYWNATAEPSQEGFYSYHLSSLYAPLGMFDWYHYVNNWLEIHPQGQPRKESEYKTFRNVVLGLTYEGQADAPTSNKIQGNTRDYKPWELPEKMSLADNNGKLVLVTCAADMNGKVEDARLDFEVVAWAESGASYSVAHGSIGTFVPREKTSTGRSKWTYEHNKENSVWPEFERILGTQLLTDTGRKMEIFITGLDSGHYTNFAYEYCDKSAYNVKALKGKDADKFVTVARDSQSFHVGKERNDLFLIEVGLVKDKLSSLMQLNWEQGVDTMQPAGFMNYPTPTDGLYNYKNFFAHYESEHKLTEANKDGVGVATRWKKIKSDLQNHMWDCRVYNMALRDIFIHLLGAELKIRNFTWADYIVLVNES